MPPQIFVRKIRPAHWARKLAGYSAVILPLLVGVFLSFTLYSEVKTAQQKNLQAAVAGQAAERAQLLRTTMLRSMEGLHSIESLFATRADVSRSDFRTFVERALSRQPELQAMGWTPRVPAERREAMEAAARADGLSGFQFLSQDRSGRPVRAGKSREYFPIYFIEPADRNQPALGFDLSTSSIRFEALDRACETALPVATPPMRLLQESANQLGFVVYLPVFDGWPGTSPGDRQRRLRGYASAVFRIDDLLTPTFAGLAGQGLSLRIVDDSTANVIYSRNAGPAGAGAPTALGGSASLDVSGRQWTVTLLPAKPFIAAHMNGLAGVILFTGLLITFLLCAYLYSGLRRTAEIERRVVERTAQLSSEVAERERAERAARLAEANYRSIFENSVEGIFQTSPDGRYLSANRALTQIYGYESPQELMSALSNIAGQLYVDSGRREEFIRQVQRDGAVSEFDSQVYRKDGNVIWISEHARTVRDEAGRVLYYEGTVIDVTERKRAQDALRRSNDELEARVRERTKELALSNAALQTEIAVRKRAEDAAAAANRAKSDFLARMSHEIRTPMNAILGYAQILHRDPALRGSPRDALKTILDSGTHLISLIDDILDISKIEAGRTELRAVDFDLDALVRSIAAMFRQRCSQKGLTLRAESPGPARVHGDERKLRQVLINLLGNAVKFTDEGVITLRVTEAGEQTYRFEVTDTGVGIPRTSQSMIFNPFRQGLEGESRGGSGLGLAIAKQQLELMGGELCLASQPGIGSRFYFVLGLGASASASTTPPRGEIIALAPGYKVRAMVVDDISENREVLAGILSMVGCEVVTASDGSEAIDLASASCPDIAFIDLLMPGLDGLETARQLIHRHGSELKLVATSASAFSHEQKGCLEAGFHDVLAKPVRCERLFMSLASLLKVEFVYAAAEAEPPSEIGETNIDLPEPLTDRLRAAAELYNVTDLKRCIQEVEQLGGAAARRLSRSLRQSAHGYDMGAILQLVPQRVAAEQTEPA